MLTKNYQNGGVLKVSIVCLACGDAMSFHVPGAGREIIDFDALKKVLKSTKCDTIALCMDNKPYRVSLSQGYDEAQNRIYFHCANEGKQQGVGTSSTRLRHHR